MHLDWVDENGCSKYKDRDTISQKLIRRRATQAAVLTKQRERSLRPRYQSDTWVAHPCSRLHVHHKSSSMFDRKNDLEAAIETFNSGARPINDLLTVLSKSNPSIRPALAVPLHPVTILQAQLSSPTTLQTLRQLSVPDEQIRYWIILALADAEYLTAISSHYGQSNCLDAALGCLAARIQDLLTNVTTKAETIRTYVKALHTLQRAIAQDAFSERYEIYYAIPLLVLFELLNTWDRLVFFTHGRGAVHFLHFIGPRGMTSELNKTLLAMQSDIMVVENLRDGNGHCCADSDWQNALQQTIQFDLPAGAPRSEANITLNIIATSLPDALTQVEITVKNPEASSCANLMQTLRTTNERLQNWRNRWIATLREGLCDSPPSSRSSNQHVLLAVYMMYAAILYRLMAAVPASSNERLESELNALEVAHSATEIVAKAGPCDTIGQARLSLVNMFVRTIIETSLEWQLAIRPSSQDHATSQALLNAWCLRMGRESR